jgi:hypothetical protein
MKGFYRIRTFQVAKGSRMQNVSSTQRKNSRKDQEWRAAITGWDK